MTLLLLEVAHYRDREGEWVEAVFEDGDAPASHPETRRISFRIVDREPIPLRNAAGEVLVATDFERYLAECPTRGAAEVALRLLSLGAP